MNEFKRIVDSSSDYNRFTQQNGFNAKMYGGTSLYIAQRQAKKDCVAKFRVMLDKWKGQKVLPLRVRQKVSMIEAKIEGKCMGVKSQKTLEKWLDNDWSGLCTSLGIVTSVNDLQKTLKTLHG